jgi:hypothetical protein
MSFTAHFILLIRTTSFNRLTYAHNLLRILCVAFFKASNMLPPAEVQTRCSRETYPQKHLVTYFRKQDLYLLSANCSLVASSHDWSGEWSPPLCRRMLISLLSLNGFQKVIKDASKSGSSLQAQHLLPKNQSQAQLKQPHLLSEVNDALHCTSSLRHLLCSRGSTGSYDPVHCCGRGRCCCRLRKSVRLSHSSTLDS